MDQYRQYRRSIPTSRPLTPSLHPSPPPPPNTPCQPPQRHLSRSTASYTRRVPPLPLLRPSTHRGHHVFHVADILLNLGQRGPTARPRHRYGAHRRSNGAVVHLQLRRGKLPGRSRSPRLVGLARKPSGCRHDVILAPLSGPWDVVLLACYPKSGLRVGSGLTEAAMLISPCGGVSTRLLYVAWTGLMGATLVILACAATLRQLARDIGVLQKGKGAFPYSLTNFGHAGATAAQCPVTLTNHRAC